MPGEDLYVRSYLRSYCGPDQHDFVEVGPGAGRWCRACFKEEQPSAACLICDGPGESPAVLVHESRRGTAIGGALCRICRSAFLSDRVVEGWTLAGPRQAASTHSSVRASAAR